LFLPQSLFFNPNNLHRRPSPEALNPSTPSSSRTGTSDPSPAPVQRKGCQWCATRGSCLLQSASTASGPLLSGAIRERAFRKSEVISVQSETATALAVIKVGTVVGTRQAPNGEEVPITLFGRGRVLGASAILGQSNPLGMLALSAGRLCMVDIADLYRLGATDRQFLDAAYARLIANLGRVADWAAIMHIKSLKHQLALALQLIAQEQDHDMIRLPSHVALAALLSTTRESIARGLRQLEQQGQLARPDRWHCQLLPGWRPDLHNQ
jgi:CRP/FNR family transcriptional regulator, cyclic AMP receptor protein